MKIFWFHLFFVISREWTHLPLHPKGYKHYEKELRVNEHNHKNQARIPISLNKNKYQVWRFSHMFNHMFDLIVGLFGQFVVCFTFRIIKSYV
jgi:hypothetical protein